MSEQEKITNEEIKKLMIEKGLTVERVIDTVIQENGIIGVGLISLGKHLENYCINHLNNN